MSQDFDEQPTDISIHALLAESDAQTRRKAALYGYFYPRSPCGERHEQLVGGVETLYISIHALLAESDTTPILRRSCIAVFLSTLSLRRATLHLESVPPD